MATVFIDTAEGTSSPSAYALSSVVPQFVTTVRRHGHRGSIQISSGTGEPESSSATALGVLGDAGRRITCYVRYGTTPVSLVVPFIQIKTAAGNTCFQLVLNPSNQIVLQNNTPTTLGTGSTTLSIDTWYRISISYTITSTSVYSIRIYLDENASPEISVTNGTALTTTGSSDLLLGSLTSSENDMIFFFSDVYADDGNTLDNPGNIELTAKLPNATNVNNFDTVGGGSPPDRWGYISDRPVGTGSRIEHNAVTDVQENFGLQSISIGDRDITGVTLIARCAWIWASRLLNLCSHRGSAAASTANPSTTFAITIPSNTATGDSLFVSVTSRGHTVGTAYPTVTDNDTGGNTWARISESTDRKLTLWWKRATSGTASKTITVAGCVTSATGGVAVFQGAATSVTPYTDITFESNASGNESHASLAPTNEGSAICFTISNYFDDLAVTNVSGAKVGALGQNYEKLSTAGTDCGNTFWSLGGTDPSPTDTGTITWTQTNATTYSISFAVRPEHTPGSPDIMNNGTETPVVLNVNASLHTNIVDSSVYPSNAAAIGMRSSGTGTSTLMYNAGIVIAYKGIPRAKTLPLLGVGV